LRHSVGVVTPRYNRPFRHAGFSLERFSQLLTLCFSLLGKETDQATGPMIMKFALPSEKARF
jgi:hypothetical protein